MNKLSINIGTRGVTKAIMKLGEQIEYESMPQKPKLKRQVNE